MDTLSLNKPDKLGSIYKDFYLKYVKCINIQPQSKKKIISFSLYGTTSQFSNSRGFYKGIYVNYHLAKTLYPEWIIRVYMPSNEPEHIINELSQFTDIELILVETNICLRALRFLPHDDENVDVWLSRDLDSILNEREQVAVTDWLTNYPTKELHIMTDNVHHQWTIAAGMFGIKKNLNNNNINISEISKTPSLIDFMLQFSSENYNIHQSYDFDSKILEKFFYKVNNYIQHYGAGKILELSKPFPPHKPIDYDFVGCIVDINSYYGKLHLIRLYPQLLHKNTITFKNNDLFYYPPWNTNCIFTWYSDIDFTLTPLKSETSTACEYSYLKTENGDGIRLINTIGITISVLWDGSTYRNIYISDDNAIAIIHGEDHYYFTRV